MLMAACLGLLALALPLSAQTADRYKVRLTTVPMDGGMRNTVAGHGSAAATLAGSRLSISGTFDGLKSPATTAAVMAGVKRGVRGAKIADLTVSHATQGSVTGDVDLTPDQLQGLRDGRLYVQIASEKAPDGNLWGWILK